jgi:hypothetical protein
MAGNSVEIRAALWDSTTHVYQADREQLAKDLRRHEKLCLELKKRCGVPQFKGGSVETFVAASSIFEESTYPVILYQSKHREP